MRGWGVSVSSLARPCVKIWHVWKRNSICSAELGVLWRHSLFMFLFNQSQLSHFGCYLKNLLSKGILWYRKEIRSRDGAVIFQLAGQWQRRAQSCVRLLEWSVCAWTNALSFSVVSPPPRKALICWCVRGHRTEWSLRLFQRLLSNSFFCTGLLWCLFRGDDQGQCCGGLWGAGGDAGQWFSIGNRV